MIHLRYLSMTVPSLNRNATTFRHQVICEAVKPSTEMIKVVTRSSVYGQLMIADDDVKSVFSIELLNQSTLFIGRQFTFFTVERFKEDGKKTVARILKCFRLSAPLLEPSYMNGYKSRSHELRDSILRVTGASNVHILSVKSVIHARSMKCPK